MRSDTADGIGIDDTREARPQSTADIEPPERSGWRAEAPFLLLLLIAYLLPLLIVPPNADFPLIDDWNHALSVQRLVETGQLHVRD